MPILSILSEAYFRHVDTAWDYVGQRKLAKAKAAALLREGIAFSEFGTRRRRSYDAQRIVVQGLVDARNELTGDGTLRGKLTGTSNVHFARMFGLNPVGTIAHEWMMGGRGMLFFPDSLLRCRGLAKWSAMICRHRGHGGLRRVERVGDAKVGAGVP